MWDGKDPGLTAAEEQARAEEREYKHEAREADRRCAIAEIGATLRLLKLHLAADTHLCVELETLTALALNAGADFGVRPSEVLR